MLNFKLYIDDIFRTTIKSNSEDELFELAVRNYGSNVKIKIVKI